MNQQDEESKLEQAGIKYGKEKSKNTYSFYNNELDMENAFLDGAKSEAAKEYWQSLTTPAGNAGVGSIKEWKESELRETYEKMKKESDELAELRIKVKELEHRENAALKLAASNWSDSKPHTVEEGQTQEPTSSVTRESEAIGFAEWLGNECLDFDGKGNWLTPELKKSEMNDKVYLVEYMNPKSTTELYNLYKQSKKTNQP